jgi:hypothetical protein
MAVVNYEALGTTDVTTTKTLLHESIPLTGTIVSGTYKESGETETNIKNYTHGMFQTVYDYPFLSSSANHIFDITLGFSKNSALSGSPGGTSRMETKKINMYNQMSQVLLGYTSSTNTIREFELDLTLDQTGSMQEAYFINFSRLLYKDEVKPGTFSMTLLTGSWSNVGSSTGYASASGSAIVITDASASSQGGTTNTLGGDYGVLYRRYGPAGTFVYSGVSQSITPSGVGGASSTTTPTDRGVGLIFYQAGIVVLSTSSFIASAPFQSATILSGTGPTALNVAESFVSATISGSCNALRKRIANISYNNTTEINSTIYFCRVPHNKYNYSANPTYLSSSQIRVKNVASDTPVSYITTVGLYSSNNELMAIAKLSEPLKKDPTNEITLRVRLDY